MTHKRFTHDSSVDSAVHVSTFCSAVENMPKEVCENPDVFQSSIETLKNKAGKKKFESGDELFEGKHNSALWWLHWLLANVVLVQRKIRKDLLQNFCSKKPIQIVHLDFFPSTYSAVQISLLGQGAREALKKTSWCLPSYLLPFYLPVTLQRLEKSKNCAFDFLNGSLTWFWDSCIAWSRRFWDQPRLSVVTWRWWCFRIVFS